MHACSTQHTSHSTHTQPQFTRRTHTLALKTRSYPYTQISRTSHLPLHSHPHTHPHTHAHTHIPHSTHPHPRRSPDKPTLCNPLPHLTHCPIAQHKHSPHPTNTSTHLCSSYQRSLEARFDVLSKIKIVKIAIITMIGIIVMIMLTNHFFIQFMLIASVKLIYVPGVSQWRSHNVHIGSFGQTPKYNEKMRYFITKNSEKSVMDNDLRY